MIDNKKINVSVLRDLKENFDLFKSEMDTDYILEDFKNSNILIYDNWNAYLVYTVYRDYVWVDLLYVKKEHRGNRISSLLIDFLYDLIKNNEHYPNRISLGTLMDKTNFYKKIGFDIFSVTMSKEVT